MTDFSWLKCTLWISEVEGCYARNVKRFTKLVKTFNYVKICEKWLLPEWSCESSFSIIIFRRNFYLERKIFNSVIGVFFLFLKLPMTRRVQVCRDGVLYSTSIGCHCGSEAGGGGFESHYWPHFVRLLRYSLTRSYFLTTKIKNWGFLRKS